ncbi:MAG TPA: fumarate reductase subunit C [Terriglobia bacterium]
MAAPVEYVPKTFRPRVSTYWWLGRWPYLKFILRELSSVSVAWFVVITLLQIRALKHGPSDYLAFQDWLRNPVLIAMNVIALLFVLFHAVTWFNLAPKAMAVRLGGKRVPGLLIAAPNYVAWIAVSAVVAWVLLRG